MRLLGISEQIT